MSYESDMWGSVFEVAGLESSQAACPLTHYSGHTMPEVRVIGALHEAAWQGDLQEVRRLLE